MVRTSCLATTPYTTFIPALTTPQWATTMPGFSQNVPHSNWHAPTTTTYTPLAATRTLVFTNNMRSGTSVAPNLRSRTFPGGRKEQWPHYTLVVNITPLTSHPVYGSVICLC